MLVAKVFIYLTACNCLPPQVRFGARTGAAPVFLGLVKLGLGLLFGSSLLSLLKNFPSPLLGEPSAAGQPPGRAL